MTGRAGYISCGRSSPRFNWFKKHNNSQTARPSHQFSRFSKITCTQSLPQRSTDTPVDSKNPNSKMSNHLLLKPCSTSSLYRETDFRITGPNLELDEVCVVWCTQPFPSIFSQSLSSLSPRRWRLPFSFSLFSTGITIPPQPRLTSTTASSRSPRRSRKTVSSSTTPTAKAWPSALLKLATAT